MKTLALLLLATASYAIDPEIVRHNVEVEAQMQRANDLTEEANQNALTNLIATMPTQDPCVYSRVKMASGDFMTLTLDSSGREAPLYVQVCDGVIVTRQ